MRRFDWRIVLASVVLFIVPPLAFPSSGVLSEGITSYTYGFPFSWFTVYFSSRGGKALLVQALSEPHNGISISVISAAMNLLILYIVLSAVVTVFGRKKRAKNLPELPPGDAQPAPTAPSDEADAQSMGSSGPADSRSGTSKPPSP